MADPPRLPNSERRVSRICAMKSSGLRHPSVGVVAVGAAEPPSTSSWDILQRAAHSCEACPLYQNATQTVFGEGPRNAKIVLLGEQPGDAEDREGRPFIGHAGRLLDRALTQAGLDREKCYVTNAVKHLSLIHISEPTRLLSISYAVFCLKKKK